MDAGGSADKKADGGVEAADESSLDDGNCTRFCIQAEMSDAGRRWRAKGVHSIFKFLMRPAFLLKIFREVSHQRQRVAGWMC